MKALRKIIAAVILSVAAVVMCLNLPALRNKVLAGMTGNGIEYEIDEKTGTVTITGYSGGDATVVIPSEIEGKKVSSIGFSAFEENWTIESIIIPDSVTSIGGDAFYYCPNLTSITIPDSVTSIGEGAFYECCSLKSIVIPSGVEEIRGIFSGCTSLNKIVVDKNNAKYDSRNNCNAIIESETNKLVMGCDGTVIPGSVTSIGNYAFSNCDSLTDITIPDSVTSIEHYAFYYCDNLTGITIPDSVTDIEKCIFYGCNSLTSIVVDDKNITYDSRNNCNAIIDTATNELIAGCNSSVIPSGVTGIGDFAFSGCEGLTDITIPEGVTNIGDYAFYGCDGLTDITIPDGVTSIGENAFDLCYGLTSITIPDSVTSIGESAFWGCEKLIIYVDMESRVGDVKTLAAHEYVVFDPNKYHKHIGGTATCNEKAKCSFCGEEYGEIKHSYSDEWKTDGTNHWHECTICGAKKDEVAHRGGTATCTAKAKCADCGKEYGKAKGHSYSKTWTSDENNHWHVCTVCGVKKDIAAHKGGTATCTAKAKCADCGKEYGKAKGHTYTYIYTKATTRADGKIVKKCKDCGKVAATSVIKKPATLTTANTSYAYTGSQIKPSVTVRDSAGKTIPATEYTVTYGTNKAVGKGTVKITFKGKKYSGTMTKTFNIIPKATAVTSIANGAAGITIKWSKNTTGTGYMIYRCETGAKYKRIKTIGSNAVLSYTDTNVVNGKAYKYKVLPYKVINEINYYNNTGAGKTTYRLITPTVKAANTAAGSITVKWSRNAAVTGYQVVYKVGTASKTLTFTDKMIGSTVIKSLKKGSTCKIYVRSFTKNGTSTFYSGWSAVNTVKIVK